MSSGSPSPAASPAGGDGAAAALPDGDSDAGADPASGTSRPPGGGASPAGGAGTGGEAGPADGASPGGGSHIRLRLPADPAFVSLPPITASGVAERLGFSPAQIEGLCTALGHSLDALLALPSEPGRSLLVDFTLLPRRLEVELEGPGTGPIPSTTWQRLTPAVAPLVTSIEPAGPGLRIAVDGTPAPTS